MHDINLIAFPGAPNLPIFAGLENGFFRRHGVNLLLETTPSSVYQFERLHAGECHIAGTAFDNVVAYREGHGAVALDGPLDVVAFMGATQIELSLVADTTIRELGDLRGKTIAMDALATGFAFVLYHMLEAVDLTPDDYELVAVGATPHRWESVKNGEHAATLTIEPFTTMARVGGFPVLAASTDCFEHYQGGVFATRESWAASNDAACSGFVAGYLECLDWVCNEDNRAACATILMQNMPAIDASGVDRVLDKVLSAKTGLSPAGQLSRAGIETVLGLRSRFHKDARQLADLDSYLDLNYLPDALT